jgi:hypothetical protein
VEFVHQPRLGIVEELGAHRLGVLGASPFRASQKKSVSLSVWTEALDCL